MSCYKLSNIVLPSGLREIGEYAFMYTKLSDIFVPASVQIIANGAFASCDISTIKTEQGSPFRVVDACLIDTAHKKLIAGCPHSVIPEDGSVTSIATNAFCGYDFDSGVITISLAVTVIENLAFEDCDHLIIHCKEDKYETDGFDEQWYEHPEPWEEDCYDEDELTVVEWGCMSEEERAEKDRLIREREEAEERFRLSQLNDYIRENGVMSMYVGAGGDVVIPPDVKIICKHAFDDCDNIKSVIIHYFVEAVEEGTFDKFAKTKCQFYFQADKSPQGFKNYRFNNDQLYFGFITDEEREQIDEQLAARRTEELALRGFEVQGDYLRKYNGNEENVVLPYNDIKTVDKSAFINNKKIKSVHFGTVNDIWDNAFENCVNLEEVILPDTVERFSDAVFCNCEKLDIKRFPVLTKSIGAGAFRNTGLENIELEVDFVGNGAFSYCKKLKKVVLNNDGRVTLRWQAFHDCRSLEEVQLNYESKEIEWGMFEGCSSLKRVKLPKNLQIIGDGAFKDCSNLVNIEIPSTVTEIQSQAFLNCKSLQNLTIPNSVTEIGDGAFLGCSGWTLRTTITLPRRFKKDLRRIFGEWKDPFEFNDGPTFKFI